MMDSAPTRRQEPSTAATDCELAGALCDGQQDLDEGAMLNDFVDGRDGQI